MTDANQGTNLEQRIEAKLQEAGYTKLTLQQMKDLTPKEARTIREAIGEEVWSHFNEAYQLVITKGDVMNPAKIEAIESLDVDSFRQYLQERGVNPGNLGAKIGLFTPAEEPVATPVQFSQAAAPSSQYMQDVEQGDIVYSVLGPKGRELYGHFREFTVADLFSGKPVPRQIQKVVGADILQSIEDATKELQPENQEQIPLYEIADRSLEEIYPLIENLGGKAWVGKDGFSYDERLNQSGRSNLMIADLDILSPDEAYEILRIPGLLTKLEQIRHEAKDLTSNQRSSLSVNDLVDFRQEDMKAEMLVLLDPNHVARHRGLDIEHILADMKTERFQDYAIFNQQSFDQIPLAQFYELFSQEMPLALAEVEERFGREIAEYLNDVCALLHENPKLLEGGKTIKDALYVDTFRFWARNVNDAIVPGSRGWAAGITDLDQRAEIISNNYHNYWNQLGSGIRDNRYYGSKAEQRETLALMKEISAPDEAPFDQVVPISRFVPGKLETGLQIGAGIIGAVAMAVPAVGAVAVGGGGWALLTGLALSSLAAYKMRKRFSMFAAPEKEGEAAKRKPILAYLKGLPKEVAMIAFPFVFGIGIAAWGAPLSAGVTISSFLTTALAAVGVGTFGVATKNTLQRLKDRRAEIGIWHHILGSAKDMVKAEVWPKLFGRTVDHPYAGVDLFDRQAITPLTTGGARAMVAKFLSPLPFLAAAPFVTQNLGGFVNVFNLAEFLGTWGLAGAVYGGAYATMRWAAMPVVLDAWQKFDRGGQYSKYNRFVTHRNHIHTVFNTTQVDLNGKPSEVALIPKEELRAIKNPDGSFVTVNETPMWIAKSSLDKLGATGLYYDVCGRKVGLMFRDIHEWLAPITRSDRTGNFKTQIKKVGVALLAVGTNRGNLLNDYFNDDYMPKQQFNADNYIYDYEKWRHDLALRDLLRSRSKEATKKYYDFFRGHGHNFGLKLVATGLGASAILWAGQALDAGSTAVDTISGNATPQSQQQTEESGPEIAARLRAQQQNRPAQPAASAAPAAAQPSPAQQQLQAFVRTSLSSTFAGQAMANVAVLPKAVNGTPLDHCALKALAQTADALRADRAVVTDAQIDAGIRARFQQFGDACIASVGATGAANLTPDDRLALMRAVAVGIQREKRGLAGAPSEPARN